MARMNTRKKKMDMTMNKLPETSIDISNEDLINSAFVETDLKPCQFCGKTSKVKE
jgi:hypothetical protein